MADCKILEMDLQAACWVVRPGRGYAHYNEFLFGKVAAIGHLDEFITSDTKLDKDSFDDVFKEFYKEGAKEGLTQYSIASNLSQVKKFLFDMKVGDLIFTIGEGSIVAGVITSDAYISEEPISLGDDSPVASKGDLNFKLRRGVDWGQAYSKDKIPLAIKRSFMANQTVFSAAEHIKYIYHWLNVVFINDNTIYTSSKINQTEDIHHYSVTKFSETLNALEALATIIDEGYQDGTLDTKINVEQVLQRLEELAFNEELNLTTQQLFMSPGDYWTGFTGKTRVATIAFTIAICCLFDITPVFASQEEMDIAEAIYEPVSAAVERISDKNNMELVVNKLELAFPEQNKKVVNKSDELRKNFPRVTNSSKGTR